MKKLITLLVSVLLLATFVCTVAFADEEENATIVEANWVTQTLEWGETVTGVRIEYDDEIFSGDLQLSQFPTYALLTNREYSAIYCNNTGKLGDVEVWGKYVFIEFAIPNDFVNYTDYIVFNENSKVRDKISPIYLEQQNDVRTRSGKVATKAFISLRNEIRYDIDKFTTFDHPYVVDGEEKPMQYHLYIPENSEEKALPLIVHFGHDIYQDYTGNNYGPLIAHNECTVWASDEFQERHPAYVLTVAGLEKMAPAAYKEVIDEVCNTYGIDTTRIYGFTYAGSTGNFWTFVADYPDVMAAGIVASTHPTSFDTNYSAASTDETLEAGYALYKKVAETIPLWCFNAYNDLNHHAEEVLGLAERLDEDGNPVCIAIEDDMWNGLLRGDKARAQVEQQVQKAEEQGADDFFTMFIPSTILFTDHWSWTAVYNNPGVQDWLLDQVNDAPYVPAE